MKSSKYTVEQVRLGEVLTVENTYGMFSVVGTITGVVNGLGM